AVEAILSAAFELEPELRRDHDLIANRGERLADELLVREGPVGFGGVEERDAAFDGQPDERDHLLLVCRRTVAKTHRHAAQPESRRFQVALSKFAFLHCYLCPKPCDAGTGRTDWCAPVAGLLITS